MEQLTQLKQMRDDALTRLQLNADYKLLISLDRLIREIEQLETMQKQAKPTGSIVSMIQKEKEPVLAKPATDVDFTPAPPSDNKTAEEIDIAFDKLASDLQEEMEAQTSIDSDEDANKLSESDDAPLKQKIG